MEVCRAQYFATRRDLDRLCAIAVSKTRLVTDRPSSVDMATGRDEVFDLYGLEKAIGLQPTIVWVHGGGFIAGSKEGIANYTSRGF